ncbi:MAG: hypothetical protein ACPG7E_05620 [Marinirhabdus sp.]
MNSTHFNYRVPLFALLFFGIITSSAQGTINVMSYNILDFPSAGPSDRPLILKDILDQYQPDIFMACELETEAGADVILNQSLDSRYSRAPFVANTSGSSAIHQMVFYRNDKFTLEETGIVQTNVRDINHYLLKLNTLNGNSSPVRVNLYVAHLKSSQGSQNENLRLGMVQAFTAHLATLDPAAFVIFAGDLNLYNSNEPAYLQLLDPTNPIVMKDPIDRPGLWHTNLDFRDIHTQSTRTSAVPFGAGAGGGMDDRFDFMTISENMTAHPLLHYLPNSYRAYGNNGNCYNKSINDPACSGVYGQGLRDKLYNMSDHLPVVMQLETSEEIVLGSAELAVPQPKIVLERTVVHSQLSLHVPLGLSGPVRFEVFNTYGQRVLTFSGKAAQKLTVPVGQLSGGMYYICSSPAQQQPLKFIITR